MNIRAVAANLRNTITNKEKMLSEVNRTLVAESNRDTIVALDTTAKFLHININELKQILADVEKCVTRDAEQSWSLNPDRAGGQFTDEEIDRAGEWR